MYFLRLSFLKSLLLAVFVSVGVGTIQAEPAAPAKALHYSLTEATCNRERNRLILTVRVQTADLETLLSERAQKKISTADMSELAPLALEYVREHLIFRSPEGETLKLEWAGSDVTDAQLFLFFEAPSHHGLLGAKITNTLFLEKLPDQINALELRDGAVKKTLVFSRDHSELVIDTKL